MGSLVVRNLHFLEYFTLLTLSLFFLIPIQKVKAQNIHVYENSSSYPAIHQKKVITKKSENPPLINFINNAKASLDIEIYEMRETVVQEAVLNALKRGVKVRIVGEPDPVGNGCDVFSRFSPKGNRECYESFLFTKTFLSVVNEYKKRYPRIRHSAIGYFNKNLCYDPIEDKPSYCYQHGKMIIRDGRDILISTGNFNDTGLCLNDKRKNRSCNRDFTIVEEDSNKAMALSEIFELDLSYSAPCDLPPKRPRPNNVVRQYTESLCLSQKESFVEPLQYQEELIKILKKHREESNVTVGPILPLNIVKLIENAKKTIQIQAQYLKEPDWHEAILRAASRGVKIEITLASFCHFNQTGGVGTISYNDYNGETGYFKRFINPMKNHPSRNISLKVLNHEIPYIDGKGHSGYLHSKVFIIDKKEFWIGSTNGSRLSTLSNREYGIIIREKGMANKMSKILSQDHKHGISLERHIPPYQHGENQGKIAKGGCRIAPKSKGEEFLLEAL